MNSRLNCIAIDDEPLALDLIGEFCSRIPFLTLTGTFTNPFDAVQVLNNDKIDLLFIDIRMPQISGIEFLRTLYNPPLVIITSAFKEYAYDGYENNAVDFLLKPFTFERFSRAVNKAFQHLRIKLPAENQEYYNSVPLPGFLMVKVEYSTIRVDLNDVLYIEGLKDYVKIFTEGKLVLTKTTMKNIMGKLPPSLFFRVHKSYIVAVDKIDMIENSRIVIGNQRIPIGESFRSGFFRMLNRSLI
jgi:two-component system, LytTR family, response regulator